MQRRWRKIVNSILIATLLAQVLAVTPVLAEPTGPFAGASSEFTAPPGEAVDFNVGDWGVSQERGAATYTYPIEVPPGRNGGS